MPEIHIYFKKADGYKVMPVSGAWGGLTPQGLVHCDFFVEKSENPERVVMSLDETTGEAREISRSPEQNFVVRESLVGVMMQPDMARSIGKWLIAQADDFDNRLLKREK